MRTPLRSRVLFALVATAALAQAARSQALPPPPPPPAGNAITAAKVNLGKALFWDEQLSSNATVACGTCHQFTAGGSDPRSSGGTAHPGPDGIPGTPDDVRGSPGVSRIDVNGEHELDPLFRLLPQTTGRKSPSVVNSAYVPQTFWDGRAQGVFRDPITDAIVLNGGAALESQAVAPPVSDVEMAHEGTDWNDVAARVAAATPLRLAPSIPAPLSTWIAGRSYPELFLEAFGTTAVTPARIAMAIATYERVLVSNQAPFDAGPGALTPQEQQGQQIFNGIGRCNICHAGPRQTNDTFRYIGVRPQDEDLGRFVVTGNPADRGRMKVPSLRNVELRAPYFHNGGMATLEDVVAFYNRGGDFNAPNKDPNIVPLGLNATQRANLVAFLRRPLTDPRVAAGQAPFDHPTLSAGVRTPAAFGAPTAGTDGFEPEIVALEPPFVGNGAFTVGIDRALGGARAILAFGAFARPSGTVFQGATSYLDLSQPLSVRRMPLNGAGAGEGYGSATITLPNDPLLVGTTFYAQWFVFDFTANGRFSATRAVSATRF